MVAWCPGDGDTLDVLGQNHANVAGARGVCRPALAVDLAAALMDGQVRLSWLSHPGWRYQLQSATALSAPTREDEGAALLGTGRLLVREVSPTTPPSASEVLPVADQPQASGPAGLRFRPMRT